MSLCILQARSFLILIIILMNRLIKSVSLYLLLLVPSIAHAHVGYVEPRSLLSLSGQTASFYHTFFENSTNLVLLIVIPVFSVAVLFGLLRVRPLKEWGSRIAKRANSYQEYVQWIIRLSLGIGFIGAAISNVLVSPVLGASHMLSTIEMLIGFWLLAGFLLPVSYILVILLYLVAVSRDYYLLGNLDVFALGVSGLILGSPKPGVDHLLGFAPTFFARYKHYVPMVLRFVVGAEMILLSIYEKFLNPGAMHSVILDYNLTQVIPVSPELWVVGTGLVECAWSALGAWN